MLRVFTALLFACTSSAVGYEPDTGLPCDFAEGDDALNGDLQTPEDSGLVFTEATTRRICGEVDAAFASADHGDFDVYAISLDESRPLRLELLAPSGERAPGLQVGLWAADGSAISSGDYGGGYAISGATATAGLNLVSVRAGAPGPSEPVSYTLVVRQAATRCPRLGFEGIPGEYMETNDGADSRGNDLVAVSRGPTTDFAPTAADDAPEPGLVLRRSIFGFDLFHGVSADVPSSGDSYYDRDSIRVVIAGEGNELVVNVGRELDLFVFEADNLERDITSGIGSEIVTSVEPGGIGGRELIVWVGQRNDQPAREIEYGVSLCLFRFDSDEAAERP